MSTTLFSQNEGDNITSIRTKSEAIEKIVSGNKTYDEATFAKIDNLLGECQDMLDLVKKNGTHQEYLSALYFVANDFVFYANVLRKRKNVELAYKALKPLEATFALYIESDFPLTYSYSDKSYSLTWNSFLKLQSDYYYAKGLACYDFKKYKEAYDAFSNCIQTGVASADYKYYAYLNLISLRGANVVTDTDEHYANNLCELYRNYLLLPSSFRKEADEQKYSTDYDPIQRILDEGKKTTATPQILSRCAIVASLAADQLTQDKRVLSLFDLVYTRLYDDTNLNSNSVPLTDLSAVTFANDAQNYAKSMLEKDKTKAFAVGVKSVNQMAALNSAGNDCEKCSEIAHLYNFWSQPQKEAVWQTKAKLCLDERIRQEKEARRRALREKNNINLYSGIYAISALNHNYGGVVNVTYRRFALEVSYLNINRKRENTYDLNTRSINASSSDISKWNGYYAHIQPKFFTKSSHGYWGIIAGYCDKKFEPYSVMLTDNSTKAFSYQMFAPTVKQYIGMLNFGVMGLNKVFGIDFYAGVGANYSTFDRGNANDLTGYTINNPIIANRKKNYFGLIMRLGLSVGLNLGPGFK
ncbi:MAG: hypothetical protein PHV20_04880 [Bacteroidales bacterium]|nr:hypothetical protein [Bacteroidales bacterium]